MGTYRLGIGYCYITETHTKKKPHGLTLVEWWEERWMGGSGLACCLLTITSSTETWLYSCIPSLHRLRHIAQCPTARPPTISQKMRNCDKHIVEIQLWWYLSFLWADWK